MQKWRNFLIDKEKGINLTPSQLEARNITTINGVVSIFRRRLRPVNKESKALLLKTEGVKSIAPLDCFLGIDKLPFKMTAAAMLECAYWAQDQVSFQRAEEKIKRTLHISIDDDTIRKAAG